MTAPTRPVRRILSALLRRFHGTSEERERAGYELAELATRLLYPKFLFSEHSRIWLDDREFLDLCRFSDLADRRSADRKHLLWSLANLVEELPGDTAEAGAYEGASSLLICHRMQGSGKEHHVFDSFEGLSPPGPSDGGHWKAGDLKSPLPVIQDRLAAYDFVRYYPGWIPSRFPSVSGKTFCLVHLDIDLYRPTLDSLEFFYPRLVPGGVILCDDYGFSTCPGARKAMDDYMRPRPEKVVHVPTGQGFIIKR